MRAPDRPKADGMLTRAVEKGKVKVVQMLLDVTTITSPETGGRMSDIRGCGFLGTVLGYVRFAETVLGYVRPQRPSNRLPVLRTGLAYAPLPRCVCRPRNPPRAAVNCDDTPLQ